MHRGTKEKKTRSGEVGESIEKKPLATCEECQRLGGTCIQWENVVESCSMDKMETRKHALRFLEKGLSIRLKALQTMMKPFSINSSYIRLGSLGSYHIRTLMT